MKRKTIFSLFIIAITLFLSYYAGLMSVCAQTTQAGLVFSEEEAEFIRHNPVVTYAPDPDYAPFEFQAKNGKIEGLTRELLDLLELYSGLTFKALPLGSWEESLESVKQGKAVMLTVVHETEERSEYLSFTDPYLEVPDAVIIRTEDSLTITSLSLNGKKVAVIPAYAGNDYLIERYPGIRLMYYASVAACLNALKSKECDAAIMNLATANHYIKALNVKGLRTVGFTGFVYHLRIGIRNDEPILLGIVNKCIGAVTDRQMDAIIHKWMDMPTLEPSSRNGFRIVTAIIAFMIVLVLGFIFWNRSLRRQVDRRTAELDKQLDERQRFGNLLAEREENLRQMVERNPLGIVLIESDQRISLINKHFTGITGYTLEDIPNLDAWFHLAFPRLEDRNPFIAKWMKLNAGKCLLIPVQCNAGVQKNISLWKVSLGNAQEMLLIEDVTARMKQETIREIMMSISIAAHQIRDVKTFYGIIRQELNHFMDTTNFLIGQYFPSDETVSLLYMADQKDHFERFSIKNTLTSIVIRNKRPLLLNEKAIEKLEDEGLIEKVGSPCLSWLGVPLMISDEVKGVIVIQDYDTDNAYSEEDMQLLLFIANQLAGVIIKKQSEESLLKLSSAVTNSPASVIIMTHEWVVEYANPRFFVFTGYVESDVIGQDYFQLFKEGDEEIKKTAIKKALEAGKVWNGEAQSRKQDGAVFWFSLSISPIVTSEGKITHFVAISQDITDKKYLDLQLVKSKEKAEESDRLKSVFLAMMSHELRTPLNAIIGFSDLIDENTGLEEILRFGRIINESGHHLHNIIEDIFDISTIESGQMKIHQEEFNLPLLFDGLKNILGQEMEKYGRTELELRFYQGDNDGDFMISTDRHRLMQIMINLLKNAVKFTRQGFVECGYKNWEDGYLLFWVSDSGIGIPKDKHEVIFDLFRQADDSHTRAYAGTGIGLSISKRLVELLGGNIWVESEPEKGSCFYFSIPCLVNVDPDEVQQTIELNRGHVVGRKVLVAEDDDSNYALIHAVLSRFRIHVLRAENGQIAIDRLREEPDIALILMDVKMPKLNGLDATRLIREFDKNTPIVALTAYAMDGDRERAIEAGCNDYLSKPVDKSSLIQLISNLMRGD